MSGPVFLICLLLMAAGLFVLPNLNAAPEMDRKMILAMEKIREEMKKSGELDDPVIKEYDDEMYTIPVPVDNLSGIEEEIIQRDGVPEVVIPAKKETHAGDKEIILSVSEEPAVVLPAATPVPEEVTLKKQLACRNAHEPVTRSEE